jgi:hypothetical protein
VDVSFINKFKVGDVVSCIINQKNENIPFTISSIQENYGKGGREKGDILRGKDKSGNNIQPTNETFCKLYQETPISQQPPPPIQLPTASAPPPPPIQLPTASAPPPPPQPQPQPPLPTASAPPPPQQPQQTYTFPSEEEIQAALAAQQPQPPLISASEGEHELPGNSELQEVELPGDSVFQEALAPSTATAPPLITPQTPIFLSSPFAASKLPKPIKLPGTTTIRELLKVLQPEIKKLEIEINRYRKGDYYYETFEDHALRVRQEVYSDLLKFINKGVKKNSKIENETIEVFLKNLVEEYTELQKFIPENPPIKEKIEYADVLHEIIPKINLILEGKDLYEGPPPPTAASPPTQPPQPPLISASEGEHELTASSAPTPQAASAEQSKSIKERLKKLYEEKEKIDNEWKLLSAGLFEKMFSKTIPQVEKDKNTAEFKKLNKNRVDFYRKINELELQQETANEAEQSGPQPNFRNADVLLQMINDLDKKYEVLSFLFEGEKSDDEREKLRERMIKFGRIRESLNRELVSIAKFKKLNSVSPPPGTPPGTPPDYPVDPPPLDLSASPIVVDERRIYSLFRDTTPRPIATIYFEIYEMIKKEGRIYGTSVNIKKYIENSRQSPQPAQPAQPTAEAKAPQPAAPQQRPGKKEGRKAAATTPAPVVAAEATAAQQPPPTAEAIAPQQPPQQPRRQQAPPQQPAATTPTPQPAEAPQKPGKTQRPRREAPEQKPGQQKGERRTHEEVLQSVRAEQDKKGPPDPNSRAGKNLATKAAEKKKKDGGADLEYEDQDEDHGGGYEDEHLEEDPEGGYEDEDSEDSEETTTYN